MVVVIDTLRGILCVPRVVAMSVESELVAQFFSASFTFGRDVIYLYEIPWSKIEFTPSAFSFLLLEEPCECPFEHRVMFKSLAPIEHISIIEAGFSLYLCMSLDTRFAMLPDFLLL